MSSKASLTIAVPTRERADTLAVTLKTCVAQDYERLEILVSDNYSQDSTRQVVESFRDPRIRYVNTGKRLSMSDNFEFAIANATADFITIIGDDDGLIPGACETINHIINGNKDCHAISWAVATYGWPSCVIESWKNLVTVPLGDAVVRRTCDKELKSVLNDLGRVQAGGLPGVYHACASLKVIREIAKSTGRFFHSMTPDVYSTMALLTNLTSYIYTRQPLSVCGSSGNSNGTSQMHGQDNNVTPLKKFLSEGNIPFHPSMTLARSFPILVAETILQVRDNIQAAKALQLDIRNVLRSAAQCAQSCSKQQYDDVMVAVIDIGRKHGMEPFARDLVAQHPNRYTPAIRPEMGRNLLRGSLCLDGTKFHVRDVYEASLLCGHTAVLMALGYHSPTRVVTSNLPKVARRLRRWCGL